MTIALETYYDEKKLLVNFNLPLLAMRGRACLYFLHLGDGSRRRSHNYIAELCLSPAWATLDNISEQ